MPRSVSRPTAGGSRFEDKPGSNPEELIGAAHAACFTMTLSRILGEAELTAEHTETRAEVTLEKQGDGFALTSVHLTLVAKIPGAAVVLCQLETPADATAALNRWVWVTAHILMKPP